jgi:Cft2 family RNA processing exonuclease
MSEHAVQLTPLGGGKEIGANAFLLRWGEVSILLDAGMHPSREGYSALPLLEPLDQLKQLDAVLISHGHLDHVGGLPYIAREYRPPAIFCTEATVEVASRMLHNTVSVLSMLGHRDFDNHRHFETHWSHEGIDALSEILRFHGQTFGEWFSVAGPVRACFFEAGHVLGAAGILLTDGTFTLAYSGDINLAPQEVHRGASLPELDRPVDALILETTYGSDEEAERVSRRREISRFAKQARKALNRGGSVLVPSFALGRTQEMLAMVARLMEKGELPRVPVRISGLGRAVNRIYDNFPHLLQPKKEGGFHHFHTGYRVLEIYPPGKPWERRDREFTRRRVMRILEHPSIIIATNGMMKEETPSAHFAEAMLGWREHAILFVGYVAPGELGARVLVAEKGDEINFGPDAATVRVHCRSIESYRFSAHSHRGHLLEVANHFAPRRTILIHGEDASVDWMKEHLQDSTTVDIPHVGEPLNLRS